MDALRTAQSATRPLHLRLGFELTPCEGFIFIFRCESLALLPLGSVTLPSLRRPPYGKVSERVILRNDTDDDNDTESESESESVFQ